MSDDTLMTDLAWQMSDDGLTETVINGVTYYLINLGDGIPRLSTIPANLGHDFAKFSDGSMRDVTPFKKEPSDG